MTATTELAKPPIDRTARAAAAVASSSAFSVLGTLLGFWATPHILHAIGSQRFGLARALTDVFAYLSLLEFGLAGASRALFATEIASNHPKRKLVAFAVTLRGYGRATIWKVCAGIALIVFCPSLLRTGADVKPSEVMLAAAIAAISMLSTPSGALMALLSAEQREYANNLVIGIQNAVITFSSLLFALLHWGIPGQVAATLVGGAFLCAALAWLTRPTWRAARRAERADSGTLTAFARLNRATFWRILAGRMALMSDRVTIAIFLGGNTVTSFHGTVRLADAVFPHLAGIGNAAWPAMVEIHNRGDVLLFSKRLREVTTTICGAAIALAAPILTINRAFVDIWLGPGFFAGWTLTLASCINVALLAIVSLWEWCFQCTQKVEAIIPVTAVACVANVVTSVAGTLLLGAPGPALGTSIAMLVIVVPWEVRLLRQHFSVPWPGLVLAMVRPIALAIPYLLACHWIGENWPPTTWQSLALYAVTSSGGWVLIAWFTVFDKDTRGNWRGRVSRLLSRLH